MEKISAVVLVSIAASSGLLAVSGLRTGLRDLSRMLRPPDDGVDDGVDEGAPPPEAADLLVDLAMILIGLAGAAAALRGLGAI